MHTSNFDTTIALSVLEGGAFSINLEKDLSIVSFIVDVLKYVEYI